MIGGWLIAAAAAPSAPAPATTPPPANKTATPPPAPNPVDNDAPARHARRTACLKDAKSKKLLGAQRTAYVKGCMGAS
jgi:hypothetical protein